MKKQVTTANSPAAIGPYSQGIVSTDSRTIYVSGQLPIHPKTGIIPEDVAAQTRQTLQNLKAILEEAGSTMSDVLKTTVYMKDMNEFGKMNEVYAEFFTEPFPARATIEVSRLAKDALVEIEAVAISR